jgi:hypothetical protein
VSFPGGHETPATLPARHAGAKSTASAVVPYFVA